jgi:hypothetical protein
VDPQNLFYSSTNGVLFDKAQTALVQFPLAIGGIYAIPDGVASIEDDAFDFCKRLSNVTIPNSVTSIGTHVFGGCTGLTNITIPGSVSNTGEYAFSGCANLASVTILQGCPSIGVGMFYGCANLTNATIPTSVTSLGSFSFAYCSHLQNLNIPSNVTEIGNDAFNGCSLTSVTIPNGVTEISADTFYNCYYLTNVDIPNGVTNIGDEAFYDCEDLASITIPASVISIGDDAFFCYYLTNIFFQGNAPALGGTNLFDYFIAPEVVYYLPGTTNWGATYGGWLTMELTPQIVIGSPGVSTNVFGFTISGASAMIVAVEVSTDLIHWQPIQTNTLTNTTFNFSNSQWTNSPVQFYRLRSP